MATLKLLHVGNERGLVAGGSRRSEGVPGPNHLEVLRTGRGLTFLWKNNY